jgi:hypothetical protein
LSGRMAHVSAIFSSQSTVTANTDARLRQCDNDPLIGK